MDIPENNPIEEIAGKASTEKEQNEDKAEEPKGPMCPKCKNSIESDMRECPQCHTLLFPEPSVEERLKKIETYSLSQLLLKEREYLFESIYRAEKLLPKSIYCACYALIFSAIYGAMVGFYAGIGNSIVMAIKIPFTIFGTILLCLPLLFSFNLYIGSRLSFFQTMTASLLASYVMSVILLALSPMIFLFIFYSKSLPFIQLINILFMVLAVWVGISLLWQSMDYFSAKNRTSTSALVVWSWTILYAFVFIQCAWTFQIFGDLSQIPFLKQLNIEGDFYTSVFDLVKRAMGGGGE